MLDPVISRILLTTLTYSVCGAVAAVSVRFINRKKPGPRFEQAAAVGCLVGAGFGAFFGFLQTLLVRN